VTLTQHLIREYLLYHFSANVLLEIQWANLPRRIAINTANNTSY